LLGRDRPGRRSDTKRNAGGFKVRLKVAAAVTAGVLAGGLAIPSAASADTAQVVYAWGYNNWGQAGADPNVAGTDLLSPVPVHGAAANVTQLSGPNGNYKGRYPPELSPPTFSGRSS
jgi:hypothetical protein